MQSAKHYSQCLYRNSSDKSNYFFHIFRWQTLKKNPEYWWYQVLLIPDIGDTKYCWYQILVVPGTADTRYWWYQALLVPCILFSDLYILGPPLIFPSQKVVMNIFVNISSVGTETNPFINCKSYWVYSKLQFWVSLILT